MALNVSLVQVSLATVAVESVLYGVYLVLAVTSLCLLVGRNAKSTRRGTSIFRSPIFIGTIGLFLTITGHWVIIVDRAFLGFIHFADTLGPLRFYGDLTQLTEVIGTGFVAVTTIISDILIIHRLWVVWGYNKTIVIIPIATSVGLIVSGIGITTQFTQYQPGQDVFLSVAGRWITSATVFTLCTTLYSTVFISWRLWHHGRIIQPYGGPSLKSILVIIVESAALWTIWSLFYLVSYRAQSNLEFIVVDCSPAIAGISCMLIHVRVGMGWAHTNGEHPSTLSGTQLSSFAVNITRVRNTNIEGFDCSMDEEQNKGMV
ncbi:hypothetical protein C8R45DRAFT_1006981 [Mycena sanguinolenta]|nr:hypothetical protein C8R45DRAFT_1006981 [Mycena sanguinolenta]